MCGITAQFTFQEIWELYVLSSTFVFSTNLMMHILYLILRLKSSIQIFIIKLFFQHSLDQQRNHLYAVLLHVSV